MDEVTIASIVAPSGRTSGRSRSTGRGSIGRSRQLEWLRALGESFQTAVVPKEKADLIHAIYERITVAGPEIVGVRLTAAAYAHGLALALPEKVEMARPTHQRSLPRMASIWVASLSRSFDQALDLMAAAVRDCTDELWESGMWQVTAPGADHQFLGPDWNPITDAVQRSTLIERWVQRRSTPWSVAWHALEVFDYDLNGEFGPWTPPPPFTGHPHWRDLPSLPAAWSRSEIAGYIDHCRQRAHDTLEDMTDEKAATLLPLAHRYQGQPYAWILTGLVVHITEHASQIRQFITTAGIALDVS